MRHKAFISHKAPILHFFTRNENSPYFIFKTTASQNYTVKCITFDEVYAWSWSKVSSSPTKPTSLFKALFIVSARENEAGCPRPRMIV